MNLFTPAYLSALGRAEVHFGDNTHFQSKYGEWDVKEFDPRTTRIQPNHVVYINNRPGKKNAPHQFHHVIQQSYYKAKELMSRTGADENDFPFIKLMKNPGIRLMIEQGLERGDFRDTTLLNAWLTKMNRGVARFKDFGLPELELIEVHAESQIELLAAQIAEEGRHPAGVILGGSSKMITTAKHDDREVQRTMDLADYLMDQGLPMLGICFGMHLLTEVAFGGDGPVVDWLHIPKGMKYQKISPESEPDAVSIKPGEEQLIFGRWPIEGTGQQDPMMRFGSRLYGLELHSQAVRYPHPQVPNEAVLARSSRIFLPERDSPRQDWYEDYMAELMWFGGLAYGTQLHPEITPELAYVLTYIPQYEKILIKSGLNVAQIRKDIEDYPLPLWAGHRFGYNWIQYILTVNYIERLLEGYDGSFTTYGHLRQVLADLYQKNTYML